MSLVNYITDISTCQRHRVNIIIKDRFNLIWEMRSLSLISRSNLELRQLPNVSIVKLESEIVCLLRLVCETQRWRSDR